MSELEPGEELESEEAKKKVTVELSRAMITVVVFSLVVLLATSLAGAWRADTLQDSVNSLQDQQDETTQAAEEAREAAKKASDDLAAAIEAQSSGDFDAEFFIQALNASVRAECLLDNQVNNAGRTCPPAPASEGG
jgi:hypothetical protein